MAGITVRRNQFTFVNPRHVVALALVGWYLMIPPLNDDNKPMTNLPLSSWWQHQAFDSAQECEDSKLPYITKYGGNLKKESKVAAYWNGMIASVAQGLCIASDDPRLKGN